MGSNPAALRTRPWRDRPRWVLIHGALVTVALAAVAWLHRRKAEGNDHG